VVVVVVVVVAVAHSPLFAADEFDTTYRSVAS